MITTTNLGLLAWDQLKDPFEHSQLANNWVKIDQHNHEGQLSGATFEGSEGGGDLLTGTWAPIGRGLSIGANAIPPFTIKRWHLAERSVGHKQLGLKQVWPENIKAEAVEEEHLKNEAVTKNKVKEKTLTVDRLDPGVLPLGMIVSWYSASKLAPGGIWAVCDGTAWVNIKPNKMGPGEAELTAGNIPDLRGRFIQGTSLENIGTTGGTPEASLAHTHTVAAHSHTVTAHEHSLAGHTHIISTDGGHNHTFASGHNLSARTNAFLSGITVRDTGGVERSNSLKSTYVSGFHEFEEFAGEFIMDFVLGHSHGGQTAAAGGNTGASTAGTSATGLTTESALGNVSTLPPFYGLAYIMRVR